jgi:hypothetical protein
VISDRAVGFVVVVPIFLAGFFSCARLLSEGGDVPADSDYSAARTAILEMGFSQDADALTFLPAWTLRPLITMGDLDPISADDLPRRPLDRHRRLFVVMEPDGEDTLADLEEKWGAPASTRTTGRLDLFRFDLPQKKLTWDFTARLPQAQVHLEDRAKGTVLTPCDQPHGGGFRCRGRPNWQRVAPEWLLVSENADRAVWAHPPKAEERLVLHWPQVEMGNRLVIRAGHTREGAERGKAEVRLRIAVDGKEVHVVRRMPAFDFRIDDVDTQSIAGRVVPVTFTIETDDDSRNHFAFDAWSVTRRGGGTP